MMSWKDCWAPTDFLGFQIWPPSHTQLQFVSTFLGWWLVIWSWRRLIIQFHLFAPPKTKSFPPGISRDEKIHVGFLCLKRLFTGDHLENMMLLVLRDYTALSIWECVLLMQQIQLHFGFFPSFLFFTLDNFIGNLLLDKDSLMTRFPYTSETISEYTYCLICKQTVSSTKFLYALRYTTWV